MLAGGGLMYPSLRKINMEVSVGCTGNKVELYRGLLGNYYLGHR